MNRSLLAASLTVLVPLGCAPRGAGRDVIRVATSAYLVDAAMFIGADEGIFAAHGLHVELVPLNRSGDAPPLLSKGEIDAASSGPLNSRTFNVIERGGDVRIVAARAYYATEGCVSDAFVVRPALLASGRVTGPASLKGLRVTTERSGSNYYYLSLLLAQGRLTLGDVEIVDMPVPMRGDALRKGLVDVATASEPWATRITREGSAVVWKRVSDVLPNRQSTFLLYGKRFLGAEHALGVRFLAAYLEAARRLRAEGKSSRNVEAIARHTRIDPGELRQMCWQPPPADPRPDPKTLAEYQSWAFRNDLLDAVAPYDRLVDTTFLDALGGRSAPTAH